MEFLDITIENNIIYLNGSLTKSSKIRNLLKSHYNNKNISSVNNIFDLDENTKNLEKIVIDLNSIDKIDTVGLATFISWFRLAHEHSKEIIFINLNSKLNYACRLYGISNVLPINVA